MPASLCRAPGSRSIDRAGRQPGKFPSSQWRYTDDKGASRVTQYTIDVPEPHRDAAEWIGPVGIGKPALSADQIRQAQVAEAIRRIVTAEAGLVQFRNMPAPAKPATVPDGPGKPMAPPAATRRTDPGAAAERGGA
jgi:hypothetical protein